MEPNWQKEFDEKFGCGEADAGCDGCDSNFRLREKHKEFIRSLLLEQKKKAIEAIKELGHQQEDGTIWCDMDEALKRLELL